MHEWQDITTFDEDEHGGLFDPEPVEVCDDEGNIFVAIYVYEDEVYDSEVGYIFYGRWRMSSPDDACWYGGEPLPFYPTQWRPILSKS